MQRNHNDVIVIFTKVPESKKVKTRLVSKFGLNFNEAALLAEAMLKDTINLTLKSNIRSICIGFHPEEDSIFLQRIVNSLHLNSKEKTRLFFKHQKGSNFDHRFSSIIESLFENKVERVIVIGSDLPYMNPKLINTSLKKLLEKPRNLILGPAREGGIYLLGITNDFNPDWIREYQMFTKGIELNRFDTISKQKNFEIFLLPPLFDIDLSEDLIWLITILDSLKHSKNNNFYHFPKFTSKCIIDLNLTIDYSSNNTRNRTLRKRNAA